MKLNCREGFRRILEKSGFKGRMPRLVACGGRNSAFEDFRLAHANGKSQYVGLWVDSEIPVADLEKTWEHLKQSDSWEKPVGAVDEQVLFMTTCMETWLVADRTGLAKHYGSALQDSALPSVMELEKRDRKSG